MRTSESKLGGFVIFQRLANFSCKGSDSTNFRFWGLCGLCHHHPTLPCSVKTAIDNTKNDWLGFNETFTKMGVGLGLAYKSVCQPLFYRRTWKWLIILKSTASHSWKRDQLHWHMQIHSRSLTHLPWWALGLDYGMLSHCIRPHDLFRQCSRHSVYLPSLIEHINISCFEICHLK